MVQRTGAYQADRPGTDSLNQPGAEICQELMAALQFEDDDVWRDCCDLSRMNRRFGPDVSRLISHRLQQLEAMAKVEDLDVLPFDSSWVDGGVEVTVCPGVSLLLIPQPHNGEGYDMTTIVVRSIRTTAQSTRR